MGLQRPWRAGLTSKLDQIAQDLVQSGFENLQEQRFLSLSGLSISGLNHLHWISPPYIQSQFLLLQSVTIASCPCTVYLWEEQLCLPCNCPLDSWWWQLDSSPKPLPKAKQTQSLSFSSYVTWSRHLTILVTLHCTLSSLSISLRWWKVPNWMQCSRCCLTSIKQGSVPSACLLAVLLLTQRCMHLALTIAKKRCHCRLMLSLLSTSIL